MLVNKNISIHLSCQQFECTQFDINEERSVLLFRSNQDSRDEICPFCGGRVHVYDRTSTRMFSVLPIFIAGIFYFAMNAIVSKSFDVFEKRMARY